MHNESANSINNMGSNYSTFECFYTLGLHRFFITHLFCDHGENQKKVTAPEMKWNNERRIASYNNHFMISSPHNKMFSYTRLLQANSPSVLTSAFISRHTLTHLKALAFLTMGSVNNGDDDNNKDSQNEGLFPPWMIKDEELESTHTFESLGCEVDGPRDARDVSMGSISILENDIIGEDDSLNGKQHELKSMTCNNDSPRNVIHLVFQNYKILPDLSASSIKLQNAVISNSDDNLGEDGSVGY